MTRDDPYTPSGVSIYECRACGERITSRAHAGTCPDCGIDLQNIAVPRE